MSTPLPEQPEGRFYGPRDWRNTKLWLCPLADGRVLRIEPGFSSDGKTNPRFHWAFSPPYYGDTLPGVFAHDALYAAELVNRRFADDEFYRLLRGFGVNYARASIYWRTVRLLGGVCWRRHTEASIAEAREFCSIKGAGEARPACCEVAFA
jgi:hypothetical protein